MKLTYSILIYRATRDSYGISEFLLRRIEGDFASVKRKLVFETGKAHPDPRPPLDKNPDICPNCNQAMGLIENGESDTPGICVTAKDNAGKWIWHEEKPWCSVKCANKHLSRMSERECLTWLCAPDEVLLLASDKKHSFLRRVLIGI